MGIERGCEFCGKMIWVPSYRLKKGWGRFCSRYCRGQAARRGKKNAWRITRRSGDGHRYYRQWREAGKEGLQRQLQSRWAWELANGPIPDGYVIHHIDRDHLNDDITNLQMLERGEHQRKHQLGRQRIERRLEPDGTITKPCPRCKQRLPLSSYYRQASSSDGHAGYCKSCIREYGRQWRKKRSSGRPPGRPRKYPSYA